MKTKDYRHINEERYNQVIDGKELITVARISFYKNLQQEDFEGIVYVEIAAEKTLEEAKNILIAIRNSSYPGSLSFKEDINLASDKKEE